METSEGADLVTFVYRLCGSHTRISHTLGKGSRGKCRKRRRETRKRGCRRWLRLTGVIVSGVTHGTPSKPRRWKSSTWKTLPPILRSKDRAKPLKTLSMLSLLCRRYLAHRLICILFTHLYHSSHQLCFDIVQFDSLSPYQSTLSEVCAHISEEKWKVTQLKCRVVFEELKACPWYLLFLWLKLECMMNFWGCEAIWMVVK